MSVGNKFSHLKLSLSSLSKTKQTISFYFKVEFIFVAK